jgi:peptidoglycan/LPS O-acetylase OafA/YrhL
MLKIDNQMRYRSDIDGLRGIAILLVLLFHLKFSFAGSGWLGVDIFFVISGFLITGTSLHHIAKANDIGDFFKRRIARILPMAALTCLAILIFMRQFVTRYFDPEILSSARSALFFYSNFHFWKVGEYFQLASDQNPFLHFWSLALEEQFYLIVPFLVLFIRNRVALFGVLAVLSFVGATAFASHASSFYLLPFRMWEFCLGALLASVKLEGPEDFRVNVFFAGLMTLILSLIAMSRLNPESTIALPWLSLFPVLGSLIMILADSKAGGRFLSFKPLAVIGSSSYVTYLIHWPILVFVHSQMNRELTVLEQIAVGLAILICAWLLSRFIEKPCQKMIRDLSLSAATGIGVMTVLFPFLVLTIFGMTFSDGGPQGQQMTKESLLAATDPSLYFDIYEAKTCFLNQAEGPEDYKIDRCLPPPNAKKKVLVWGDSFASFRVAGLKKVLRDEAFVYQATSASCPPLIHGVGERCHFMNLFFIDRVIVSTKPDVLVIAARWKRDFDKYGVSHFNEYLSQTLEFLTAQGIRIVLVGQSPTSDTAVPLLLADRLARGEDVQGRLYLPENIHAEVNADIAEVAARSRVRFFDPTQGLCQESGCLVAVAGRPLYWDYGHMTPLGSETAAQMLVPIIREELSR